MGLTYKYYVFTKKDYGYHYAEGRLVVEHRKTKQKTIFLYGDCSINVAETDSLTDHSIEFVTGIEEEIFIVIIIR